MKKELFGRCHFLHTLNHLLPVCWKNKFEKYFFVIFLYIDHVRAFLRWKIAASIARRRTLIWKETQFEFAAKDKTRELNFTIQWKHSKNRHFNSNFKYTICLLWWHLGEGTQTLSSNIIHRYIKSQILRSVLVTMLFFFNPADPRGVT